MPADAKLLRACTQCHSRKVKCDGAVPYCTPCFKSQRTSTCDTLDCVVWTHRNVLDREERHARLAARLDWLEAELSHCTGLSAADVETGTSIAARLARPEATSASDPLALELGLLALEAGSGLRRARYGYIDKVHRWSPILDLRRLLPAFDALYDPVSPSSPSSLEPLSRFSVFMVLALGRLDSQGATAQAQQQATDGFSPEEYLNAAVVSLDRVMMHSDLDAVAAALLLVLYGLSDPTHPSSPPFLFLGGRNPIDADPLAVNVWQWSGFALRLAVELGCSRPARPWQFDDAEKELRRRIWWTAYRLERTVAVRLGRVLSMRNQGIDADWPIQLEEVTPPCRLFEAPIRYSLRPALHLMRLARLLGDILESVYIARPLGRPSPSAEETLERPTSVHTVCLTSTRAAIVLAKTMLAKGELPRTWASLMRIAAPALNNPLQDGVIGQEADAGPSEAGWPLPAQVAHDAAWEGWEDFGLDSWAIDAVQSMLETGEPRMMG
ncbi:hypothetical protein Rhopal_004390-T1 [Rhodotorula paludigena]|uniref:Zn(2)-C6 fungal-type domain-containing protein n=1 Tax=Rhodotorula paludigena TaxID=86838 RepID=A0AAV5GQ35_9BASI|nr:hypothetical protein Rhopal_004390-T1 [Rhodotorula paludigena]